MLALIALVSILLGNPVGVDGDTVHDNRRNVNYRLHGLDAPEVHGSQCDAERAQGEAAAARVAELLAAAREVKAIAAWEPPTRDRWPVDGFGRRIARIEIDGRDLGAILLAEGHARPYSGDGPRPDWCAG